MPSLQSPVITSAAKICTQIPMEVPLVHVGNVPCGSSLPGVLRGLSVPSIALIFSAWGKLFSHQINAVAGYTTMASNDVRYFEAAFGKRTRVLLCTN